MYRQGDILLISVPHPALKQQKQMAGPTILGHGEVTGHQHVLANAVWVVAPTTTAEALFQFAVDGRTEVPVFIYLDEAGELVHEEHGTLTVPAGYYQVVRQREYTPERPRPIYD